MEGNQRSSWAVGWTMFAAVMMMMAGVFQIIAGLVALVEDQFYVVGTQWVFEFDTTTWGWLHMIWGALLVLVGFGILTGNVLARTVGVIAASISAVANFMFLPYYPLWALVVIGIDVAVIWALTAHGRDITMAD